MTVYATNTFERRKMMYTVIWFVMAALAIAGYICEKHEHVKDNIRLNREVRRAYEQNAKLYAECEKLADENLRLEQAMRERE